ncbi:hypothetical protein B6N60_02800 [Richelia sinica FACHB-800]|uniref:Uncharacterized protein n=1 Tax=Richelia sinica FACHB-800 TaxID=1357546 RepID=A0A975T8G7_9NOST|nr:hypothetical protein B6N60_02800 [Richelia sinica FACHB-800]
MEATKPILNSTENGGRKSSIRICINATALSEWDGRKCQSTGTDIEARK